MARLKMMSQEPEFNSPWARGLVDALGVYARLMASYSAWIHDIDLLRSSSSSVRESFDEIGTSNCLGDISLIMNTPQSMASNSLFRVLAGKHLHGFPGVTGPWMGQSHCRSRD